MEGRGKKPLVAVVGPTASGKSELAVWLAERFGGEVVNCDSMQVYRGFDVGTAKTALEERRGIPHYLIDIMGGEEQMDAGRFAGMAREAVEGIAGRGKLPVLAGGTGFYLRALLEGLAPGPGRDEALRVRLMEMERRGSGRLHRLLRRWDEVTAERIHVRDVQKLVRAVEICVLARRPASEVFAGGATGLAGFRTLKLCLAPEREALRARIRLRTAAMFRGGLVEEVRGLLAAGLPEGAKPLEAIGYKEALGVVGERLSEAQAEELTFYATCQYAKRQMTWFRGEAGVEMLEGFGSDERVKESAAARVEQWLQSLQAE